MLGTPGPVGAVMKTGHNDAHLSYNIVRTLPCGNDSGLCGSLVMRDGAITETGGFNEFLDIEEGFSPMYNSYRKTREAAS